MMCSAHGLCAELLLQLLAIGLSNGAVIALNAIGVTLVYGAVRTINFAHGDLYALSSVLVTFIIARLGLQRGFQFGWLVGGLLLALGAALLFGALLNVAVERLAFRPFRDGARGAADRQRWSLFCALPDRADLAQNPAGLPPHRASQRARHS